MAGRPIRIAIIANGRGARNEIDKTTQSVVSLSGGMSKLAKAGAGLFAISELKRAGEVILRVGNAYTSQLAQIGALADETQLRTAGGLTGVAKALEANRKQYAAYGSTVADAASGVTELVKAGQTLPNALKEINATMVLSKAGAIDVADASSLVATTLTTWKLKATAAARVTNYLANAANISTSDVSDLVESLKFVAPVAANVGVSVKQTVAYLAQLSNAGINGTLAGTGLRKVMESLQAPTGKAADVLEELNLHVFDANGKVRPFADVLVDLRKAMSGLSDQERKMDMRKIFGLTGITSAQVLLDNVKNLKAYEQGVGRAGAAAKLAEANTSGLVGTLNKLKANAVSTGQAFYREYSPKVNDALLRTVDAAGEVRDAIGKIPGSTKALVAEVAIAAIVFPRMTAALAASRVAMTSATGSTFSYVAALRSAELRSTALGLAWLKVGPILRSAAGVGGMVLLAQGASHAASEVNTLELAAGGAATGFSVAGPWGAAVGGAAGLLTGLVKEARATAQASRDAATAADASVPSWSGLASTLNQVTGATTSATRALVYDKLQRSGILEQLNAYGVSSRAAVSAALGNAKAQSGVNQVLANQADRVKGLNAQIAALKQQQSSGPAKNIVEQHAITGQINDLVKQRNTAQNVIDGIQSALPGITKAAKAVTDKAAASLSDPKAAAKARAAGDRLGTSYGQGYVGGIAAWTGKAEYAAANMANQAHAAAMRAQNSHSPSKKMRQVGKWFSQGYALGIRDDADKVVSASETLISKATGAVTKGTLKQLKKLVHTADTQTPKAIVKANAALVKSYPSVAKGLRGIAAAQKTVSDSLETANQKLAEAKQAWQDYHDQVQASVVAFGDITQLGKNSAGNATADGIISQLKTRAAAVAKYVAEVKKLIAEGLNSTSIQQILDAGVDGGLQTALAIDAGGPGAIKEINALQQQIASAGNSLGNTTADLFKKSGIQAAQGMVDGLKSQQAQLNKIATSMANSLVAAVKKALKIKSPSRVFRQIGGYTVDGLTIGLDQTRVSTAGRQLAGSLITGFGTPALDSYLSTSGSGGAAVTARVTLDPMQMAALTRGQAVSFDLDVARQAGVRQMA